eukprot:TRINITY_DN7344_c0_g1_i1.p3 TRINITY_DN7344_c0_g1~~TRINITY_DN7344_c0_g1_i1.p3  ORF type:complete len:53 (+),score=3.97 TRINITY_DN7344_c0_g1_i1:181-339(+)
MIVDTYFDPTQYVTFLESEKVYQKSKRFYLEYQRGVKLLMEPYTTPVSFMEF